MAAELGEGTDQAFEKLDAALQKQPQDAGLHYVAACAYALASQPLAKKDPAKSRDCAERAFSLLRKAIQNGYADYKDMQQDADLDPSARKPGVCRDHKGGASGPLLRRRLDGRLPVRGESPLWSRYRCHLQRCRELVSQGYRMVALSVARTSPEASPITASVWHRPVITDETRDRLAERQARAAVALVRMGKAGEILPLLRHSADPRLRSFIVNWLGPLGADPKILAAELERLPATARPTPPRGSNSWTLYCSTPRPRSGGR